MTKNEQGDTFTRPRSVELDLEEVCQESPGGEFGIREVSPKDEKLLKRYLKARSELRQLGRWVADEEATSEEGADDD